MKLGNAAWGLRQTPLEEQLRLTAAMGLELLELSIGNGADDPLQPDSDSRRIAEVRDAFAAYGVRCDCAATGNDFTCDEAAAELAKVGHVIDVAAAAGCRYLRIFAGFASDASLDAVRRRRMLECLAAVQCRAAASGLVLTVETHGGVAVENGVHRYFASATTRCDFWREILTTGVSINFDPANLAAVGIGDPAGFFRRFRDRIACIHLKDFRDVPGGVEPVACGEGRLDWDELLPVIRDFAGPVLFEYEPTEDIADGLRRSLAFVRRHPAAGL